MKNKLTLLFAILLFAGQLFAQKNFGIGLVLGGSVGKMAQVEDSFGRKLDQNRQLSYFGVAANIRTNTMAVGSGGVGLSFPLTIGYGNGAIYYDVASTVQYQLGALSHIDNIEKKGYFIGAGVGLVHGKWNPVVEGTSAVPAKTVTSITPMFEAGFRARVGRAEAYTETNLFYKINSNPNEKHNIYRIRLIHYFK